MACWRMGIWWEENWLASSTIPCTLPRLSCRWMCVTRSQYSRMSFPEILVERWEVPEVKPRSRKRIQKCQEEAFGVWLLLVQVELTLPRMPQVTRLLLIMEDDLLYFTEILVNKISYLLLVKIIRLSYYSLLQFSLIIFVHKYIIKNI